MINILFIHQSAELYGSDKTLLVLLKSINKLKYNPIVILPNEGLLTDELLKENVKFICLPVLKLHRKMFNPLNLGLLIIQTKKSLIGLNKLHKKHNFDIVYSNTLAVLVGILFAQKNKIKHIWHIHEIIKSPKLITKIFVKLISLKSNTQIVYNSKATQDFWNVNKKIENKAITILNGIKLESFKDNISILKKTLFNADKEIIIALVGRISNWKGHYILLESFKELIKFNKIKLVFVGSPPPNQEFILELLINKIKEYKLEKDVIIIPFYEQIFKIWNAIDIAVVPSLEPEPFGLVAVEAMLAKKPVIASNHGGLKEIIVNNETGFLIEPNNTVELNKAIQYLINNEYKRIEFGNNGYQKAIKDFSEKKYVESFENLISKMVLN